MHRWVKYLWAALLAMALTGVLLSARAAAPAPVAGTAASAPTAGLVTRDRVALRAAPRESAASLAHLWRGEVLEIRATRGDFVQVWDHHRERGGYVHSTLVMPVSVAATEAPQLLALLAFVSGQPGAEPLGLALAAASIQALPAAALQGAEGAAVFDAVGQLADRLADRANAASADPWLSAHTDVASRHGVALRSHERDGRVTVCYEGDAQRRLLALPAATPEQRARAALALTRAECQDLPPRQAEREALDEGLAEVLDRADTPGLAPHWRARLATRQAEVWSRVAFARAQRGDAAAAGRATETALRAVGRVDKTAIADDDLARFHAAAVRVNAVRWAAAGPAVAPGRLAVATRRTDDGQTCVALRDLRAQADAPALTERCTWGQVWAASAAPNREGTALALAVQPVDGWRELWVFRREGKDWGVQVLPPAPLQPGAGYAEFAGWEPGGQRLLVAREALAEGKTVRRFEVVRVATGLPERTAFDPDALGPFNRWADPAWKRDSLALR